MRSYSSHERANYISYTPRYVVFSERKKSQLFFYLSFFGALGYMAHFIHKVFF